MVGLHSKIYYVNKPYSVFKKVKAAIFASLDGEHARAFLSNQNVVLIKIETLHPVPLFFLRSLISAGLKTYRDPVVCDQVLLARVPSGPRFPNSVHDAAVRTVGRLYLEHHGVVMQDSVVPGLPSDVRMFHINGLDGITDIQDAVLLSF